MSNQDKIKKKLTLLQAAGLATGLLALILTATAYNQARYFSACTSAENQAYEGFFQMNPQFKSVRQTCPHYKVGTSKYCKTHINTGDPREDPGPGFRKAEARESDPYADFRVSNICSPPELVLTSLIVIGLSIAISVIALVLLLIVDFNKNIYKILQIDFTGHVITSGLFIVSSLCLLGFVISVAVGNFSCSDTMYREFGRSIIFSSDEKEGIHLVADSPERIKISPGEQIPDFASCSEEKNFVYKLGLLVGGTIFATVATVLHLVTAIEVKKEMKQLTAVTPGMVQAGPMETSAPEMESYQATPFDNPQKPYSFDSFM